MSLGYTRDQSSLILCQVRCGRSRTRSLCQVLPGNTSREVTGQEAGQVSDDRCWAVVVQNVDQILPRFVINFQ